MTPTHKNLIDVALPPEEINKASEREISSATGATSGSTLMPPRRFGFRRDRQESLIYNFSLIHFVMID
jgi:hypothetical protein